jgi:serine protease
MKSVKTVVCLFLLCTLFFSIAFGAYNGSSVSNGTYNGNRNNIMKTRENSEYLQGRIIVKMKTTDHMLKGSATFGIRSMDETLQKYSVTSVDYLFPQNLKTRDGRNMDLSKFYVLYYSSPYDAFEISKQLSRIPEVEYAEPWFIYKVSEVNGCPVNDANRQSQWGLNKILADTAWCISTGDPSVLIAIVDNGTQVSHPDLNANIWINPGEYGEGKESNGIDDDMNGKIDDWRGWDFAGADVNNHVEDNDPTPTSSPHGTHVAGIAAAVANNSIGVAGVAYTSKILAIKTATDNDPNSIRYGLQGIIYAVSMGAQVINCSWGGAGFSLTEQEIFDSVAAWGSLVVAAAGNDGNAGNPVQYPASYRGVMSVAAVDSFDVKPWYSEYNEYVDVSAPGERVYSTFNNSTYGYMSGTSMATPHASGLAALVKSVFPSFTLEQVSEQVRVTCDNINSANPSYANLLGKGRINALKALTVSSPSLRMISLSIKDTITGNGNGVLEPSEEAALIIKFKNYLKPTSSSAMITLSCSDTNIEIMNGFYPIHAVGTLETATNSINPFQIMVNQNPPPGHLVRFTLSMSDAGYSDVQIFYLLVNPTFATHDVNNVRVTLTNLGRIGFVDLTNTYGEGFVFGGGNQLYEGGLILGYSSTKVIDNIRNTSTDGQDADFSSSLIYNLTTPGAISAQDGYTSFTDAPAPSTNKLGVAIDMYSYAFTSPADSDYVILRYDIKNTSGAQITGLYVGLFFDWDMLPDYATNRTDFDPSRSLGYAWDTVPANPVYCGARALDSAAGYTGLLSTYPDAYTRSAKYSWISSGIVPYTTVADIHFVISSGPYTIAPNAKQMVGFALIGGEGLANLQANADVAKNKWNDIKMLVGVDEGKSLPAAYMLNQNYPNPFNPGTTIKFDIPKASQVSLKVYDITGREVATLVDGIRTAGSYSIPFNASGLSSGVYFYKLQAGEYFAVRKLVVVK